jgi:uncharacterized membrane protein YeaQ/YmgE (transglycosylase-associated protein family)
MEKSLKVAIIHMIAGVIASPITAAISAGLILSVGENSNFHSIFAAFVGLAILYVVGQITDRLYKDEEYGGLKKWLGDGVVPFGCVWFILWTIFYNVLVPLHVPLPM